MRKDDQAFCGTDSYCAKFRIEILTSENRRLKEQVAAFGLPNWRTPEYRREERARRAARQGRELYSLEKLQKRRLFKKAEKLSDRIRDDFGRHYLTELGRVFDQSDAGLEEKRASARDKAFKRYHADPESAREKSIRYKHANPDKLVAWQGKRTKVAADRDDGTITREALQQLFADADACPYCGDDFSNSRKSLDHKQPLCKGGSHSISNVLVCCWHCNHKKGRKQFAEWILSLTAPFRSRFMVAA